MRAASDAFLRTVTGSHAMTARARVCSTYQSAVDPDGDEVEILDGDADFDALAAVRSTLDLTTAGSGMWPRRAADLLAPYGNEIYVERGVVFGNGTTEYVGLGFFRIETPEQARPSDGPIRVSAKDRMSGIVDGRLMSPMQFAAGVTYGSIMEQLVTEVYPDAVIDWDDDSDGDVIGRAVIAEDDRYGFLDKMVTSLGKIWYWDYRGRLQVKAQPTADTPSAEVMAGAGGVLIGSSRTLTRSGVYNAIVATGQGADNTRPVRAVAVDNNPDSPTYYAGRFGPVPGFFTSSFITSIGQAGVSAEALLRRSVGLPYSVDFQSVPNPAFEPWDCVRVRQSTKEGSELHLLQRVQIPLVADRAMTAETREQTVVLVGVS